MKYNKTTSQNNDFTKLLGHELRTPLTSIRGFAQTLLNNRDKLSEQQQTKFLKIIEQQSNRLINLVENLLCASKTNEESNSCVFKFFNISKVISNCINIISMRYKNHRIIFNKKDYEVYADSNKTEQVILNLLDNACKYSDENCDVIISLKLSDDDNFVIVSIKDFGIGICEKEKDVIFEKFKRLENLLSQKVEGSGLGLYISKELVSQMGGKIFCIPQKNGTVFEVWLKTIKLDEHLKSKNFKPQKEERSAS